MAKLTRRGLIKRTSVGVGTIGALMAVPGLASAHAASFGRASRGAKAAAREPLVAYVRDRSRGEIVLLAGTREVIVRDPELVMRLVSAAQ